MKRITALFLVLATLLTLFASAITVNAATNFDFKGLSYQVRMGTRHSITAKGLTLSGVKNDPTVVKSFTMIPEKYDITIDLSVDSAEQALIVVNMQSSRIYCSVRPDSVTFMSVPESVTFGYKAGTARHSYRFVGDGSSLRFFVDGYYISQVKLHTGVDSPGITMGAYSNDSSVRTVTVYDVQMKEMDTSFEETIKNAAASEPSEEENEEGEESQPVTDGKVDVYNWPGAPKIPATEQPIYVLARQAYPRDLKEYIVKRLPKVAHSYEFDGTENYTEWTHFASKPVVENGVMRWVTDAVVSNDGFAMPDVENFTIETRARYSNTAPRHHIYTLNHGIFIHMLYEGVYVDNGKEIVYSDKVDVGTDWHDWKFRFLNNGDNYEIYFDGKMILEGETGPSSPTHPSRDFYTIYKVGDPGELYGIFEMDWYKYTPDLNVSTTHLEAEFVKTSSEYIEGEDIIIRANAVGDAEVPAIKYMIDGQVVAVGKKEDGYETIIPGMKPGAYSVYAEFEGTTSKAVDFKVVSAVKGELKLAEDKKKATFELYDANSEVKAVEFFVDGNSVATKTAKPFSTELSLTKGTTHSVSAVAKSESGIVLGKDSETVYPDLSGAQTTTNYSNEIRYSVSGDSGTASVNVSNGTYKLALTHTKDGFTYLSDKGEETFECGTGDFAILTDAYAADVYYNGMLVKSFAMPMTTEVVKNTANNGLAIESFRVTVPKERTTYFARTDIRDEKSYTELVHLPYSYVADMVVDRDENVRFYIKDGYFRTDVKLEDGKVYAIAKNRKKYQSELGAYFEDAAPVWKLLGELPKVSGDMHIRVETIGGMARIYANDQQIGVARGTTLIGGTGVAFDVEKGGVIKKFTISDASDLYFYEDEFNGGGYFSTKDFWMNEGGNFIIDEDGGKLIFDTTKTNSGWATIDVAASETLTSADVRITTGEGGFWYIFGKQDTVGGFVGYNFGTKKFELGETVRGKTVKIAEVDGVLPVGETAKWTIKTQRDEKTNKGLVQLFINGKLVVSGYSTCQNNANLGFASSKNSAYIYNINYRGNSKPVMGMIEYSGKLVCDFPRGFMSDGGTYFFAEGKSDYYFTDDGGKSFTAIPYDNAGVKLFNDVERLDNGDLLAIDHGIFHPVDIEGGKAYQQYTYISKDNGKSWEFQSIIRPETPKSTGQANRLSKTSTGRLIYPSGDDYGLLGWADEDHGNETIFYSDDNGKTWKTTDIVRSQEIGMILGESVALERSDGTIRMFFRSSPGCISYIDSHDNGATFDFSFVGTTPFQSNANNYCITKDPTNPTTWWATWGYDWSYDSNQHSQWPRERYALAVSYDEGTTWDYVGTVKEMNYDQERYGNVKGNAMDAGIFVDDKAVYVRFNGTEEADNQNQANYVKFQYVFDKSKLVPTKSWERLHLRDANYQVQGTLGGVLDEGKADRTMVVGKTTDNLFMKNEFYSGATYDGNIQAEYAAAFVGAELKTDGNTVTFTRSGTDTVFEGSSVTKANGKTFISAKDFAEKYDYKFYEFDDYRIVTKVMGWTDERNDILRYTVGDYVEPPLYDAIKLRDDWRAILKEVKEKQAAAAE